MNIGDTLMLDVAKIMGHRKGSLLVFYQDVLSQGPENPDPLVYLCEHTHERRGHCMVFNMNTGKIIPMLHVDDLVQYWDHT